MTIEIERKFLVASDSWRQNGAPVSQLQQAYLCDTGSVSIRVRTTLAGEAFLTIKSSATATERMEFEYAIPADDAQQLLLYRVGSVVEKTRYVVLEQHHKWEVDVFSGANLGLVIAEIELAGPDQAFDRPSWLGAEVTGNEKYYNSQLAHFPYSDWPNSDR